MKRRKSKTVKLGNVKIGSGHPILIQSMTKSKTSDERALFREIKALERAGAGAIRIGVKYEEEMPVLKKALKRASVPIIADVHFNHKIALMCIESGVHGIRLNPGNITDKRVLKQIVTAIKESNPLIAVRVGVNSGSIEDRFRNRPLPKAMVLSALNYIKRLQDAGITNIKASLKGSDVVSTIEANMEFASRSQVPIHLGVTATGHAYMGRIKSHIGIGGLIAMGIGDTLRVSLSDSSVKEVITAKEILSALGMMPGEVDIISCPTCSRASVDIKPIVNEVADLVKKEKALFKNVAKIAIMGCEVNGPGEARDADIGIACGKGKAFLFKENKIVKIFPARDIIKEIKKEARRLLKEERC